MNDHNSIDWQVRLWKEFDAADPAVLDQRGRQLILDIEAAWDRGDKEFVIPPGCYRTPTPLPLVKGGSLRSNCDAMVRAPAPGWVLYPYREPEP